MKRTELYRSPDKLRAFQQRARASSAQSLNRGKAPQKRRKAISPASPAQRRKVAEGVCLVTGRDKYEATIDPAHLAPRGFHGGCDDPLCVVRLERSVHRAFDDGDFDLLPYLRPSGDERRYLPEIQHALDHFDGNLIGLLQRLTGERW
jgi:hypothetical protein